MQNISTTTLPYPTTHPATNMWHPVSVLTVTCRAKLACTALVACALPSPLLSVHVLTPQSTAPVKKKRRE